jgi:hypothetical protein
LRSTLRTEGDDGGARSEERTDLLDSRPRLMLTSHSLDSRSIHAILDQVEGFIGLFERMLEAGGIGGRCPSGASAWRPIS